MTPGQILRAALDKSYAEHLEKLRAIVRNEPDYQLQEKAQALADEDAAYAVNQAFYEDLCSDAERRSEGL